jgi:hypothetical protein
MFDHTEIFEPDPDATIAFAQRRNLVVPPNGFEERFWLITKRDGS